MAIDLLSTLPPELAVTILCKCEAVDVLQARLVCKNWRALAEDDELWKHHFHRQRGWRVRDDVAIERLSLETTRWIDFYRDRHAIEENYRRGRSQDKAMHAHLNSVYCLKLARARGVDLLISGSRDDSACIWNATTLQLLHTFRDHEGSVLCIGVNPRFFATGSSDGTIVIRLLDDPRQAPTRLMAHMGSVLNLDLTEQRLIAGGKDGVVRIWDTAADFELLSVVTIAAGRPLNTIRAQDDLYAYGLAGFLFIRSMASDKTLHQIQVSEKGLISCLSWPAACPFIAVGISLPTEGRFTFQGLICLVDAHSDEVYMTFDGKHQGIVRSIMLDWQLGRLISLGYDGILLCHDLNNGKELCRVKKPNLLPGLSVAFNARSIFVGSKVNEAGEPSPIICRDLASYLQSRNAF